MTDYLWNGSASSSSTTAANWTPSGVPGASDSVLFQAGAANTCTWTQTAITNFSHTAPEPLTINVPILTVSGVFTHQGTIAVNSSQATLIIRLTGTSSTLYRFGAKTVTSWQTAEEKAKVTIEHKGTGTYHILDNGEYPTLHIFSDISPHPPTSTESTFDEVDIATLTFDSTGFFEETSALLFKSNAFEERKRVFRVRSIGNWSALKHESGKGTWIYYATSAGFELPMTGSNIASTANFVAKTGQIRITTTVTGNRIKTLQVLTF